MTPRSAAATREAIIWFAEEKRLTDAEVAQRLNITEGYVRDMLRPRRRAQGVLPASKRCVPARRAEQVIYHEAQHLMVDRDPCFQCGVRKDVHDKVGCGRWR